MKTASTVLLVISAALLAALLFFAGAAWRARITAGALAAPAIIEQAGFVSEAGPFLYELEDGSRTPRFARICCRDRCVVDLVRRRLAAGTLQVMVHPLHEPQVVIEA